MSTEDILAQLEAWGSEKARDLYTRQGAGSNQYGVNRSQVRDLAKKIKTNHPLAMELWATGNTEAKLLATLIMSVKELTEAEVDQMMGSISYFQLTDWFMTNVVKKTKFKDSLRARWVNSPDECTRRAGWSLEAERVKAKTEGVDPNAILDKIEAEMKQAPFRTQETMNYCLVEVAVRYPEVRQRGIDIANRLEVLKDYPVSKGCISPFAPIWIAYVLEHEGG